MLQVQTPFNSTTFTLEPNIARDQFITWTCMCGKNFAEKLKVTELARIVECECGARMVIDDRHVTYTTSVTYGEQNKRL